MFKVIERTDFPNLKNQYYQVINNNVNYNQSAIGDSWEYIEVVRETDKVVELYSIEEKDKLEQYTGVIVYKGKTLDYASYKEINRCVGYCCDNRDYYDNKTLRSRDKHTIRKMTVEDNYDLLFENRKKAWYDYC